MSVGIIGQAILSVQLGWKRFGAQQLLREASFTIHEGDRIGLIGRNGSGKSTLLRILAGSETLDDGCLTKRRELRVAMLDQQCSFEATCTVQEVLAEALSETTRQINEHKNLAREVAQGRVTPELEERLAWLQHELEVSDGWNIHQAMKRMALELNLPAGDRQVGSLSGGEARRLDLGATLLRRPELLLLDEPTNQIDDGSARWIETFLSGYQGTCVLVTHDRYFLDRVVNRIVELSEEQLHTFPGNYEVYLERKETREAHAARNEANRLARIRRELVWLRRGPKARTGKQKARIHRFEKLEAQEGGTKAGELSFAIPAPPRLGKLILEADGISRSFGEKNLFRGLSLIVQKGMRIGVVGPNGCGKTTLLRTLMGLEPPDEGAVLRGEATEFLYVDQNHEEVDPLGDAMHYVTEGTETIEVNGQRIYVPTYLERFLFDRATLKMPMGSLSGGERNRLDLAKKLLQGGNFLVMDEPTNDLDLPTLRVLEEAILDFDGCALVVSHDRYFLNRVCTHLLVFNEQGGITPVVGNYDDYLHLKELKRPAGTPAPPSTSNVRSRKEPAGQTAPKARRLTYLEKEELAQIEQTIQEAETRVEEIEASMAAPGFFEQSHEVVQATLKAHEKAKHQVEALYERWEALEAIARN